MQVKQKIAHTTWEGASEDEMWTKIQRGASEAENGTHLDDEGDRPLS